MALTDNLLAFYKLSDLTDSSGNNRTLTNNGNVSFASGKIGNAVVFDGQSTLVIDNISPINIPNGVTISFWTDIQPQNNYNGFVLLGEFFTGNGISIYTDPNGSLNLDNAWNNGQTVNEVFDYSGWVHVVAVRNENSWKVFKNGTSILDSQDDGSYGTFNKITLGVQDDSANRFLTGSMDAVGIWNRALSDSEVAALYNSGTGLELDGVAQPTLVKMEAPIKFFGKVKFGV